MFLLKCDDLLCAKCESHNDRTICTFKKYESQRLKYYYKTPARCCNFLIKDEKCAKISLQKVTACGWLRVCGGTTGLTLLSSRKSAFSTGWGESLAWFTWNLARVTSTFGTISVWNFICAGGYVATKIENLHFRVKSRPARADLHQFHKRCFYATYYPASVFQIYVIYFSGYRVIAEKPRISHLPLILPCTLLEKLCVGSTKWSTYFLMVSMSYITCIVWGDRTRGAGSRCENMVFVFFSLYGQDLPRSDKTAGINFTQRPKINILAQHGRLFAPINVKIGMAKRHVDSLVWAKFHVNRGSGLGGTRPQISKISTFW